MIMKCLRSLFSVKVTYIVGFVVFWNVGHLVAEWLSTGYWSWSGAWSSSITSEMAKFYFPVYVMAAIFFFLIGNSKGFQQLAIAPKRHSRFRRWEFNVLGLNLAIMTVFLGLRALGGGAG